MRFKMDLKIIFSTIFITVAICGLTMADKTTAERIRKHQEWLKQRNHGRNHLLSTAKPKKSIELLNLWRFNKNENENSINDVYPENDNILSKTTTTATAIADISITTTTMPEVTTTKTTLPATTFTTSSSTSTTTATTQQPTANISTATTTTLKPAAVAPFYNSIARFDSNFHLKSSNTSEWLSNDILETTTPFTATISTSAAPAIISTTATTTSTSTSTSTTPATTATTITAPTRKAKQRPYPRWGNWGEWSACSRSCGGGIKHQLRKCINRWANLAFSVPTAPTATSNKHK